jgi:hypothetical protein
VKELDGRRAFDNQTVHPNPFQVMPLAAAMQNFHLNPTDFLVKGNDARPIHQNFEASDKG